MPIATTRKDVRIIADARLALDNGQRHVRQYQSATGPFLSVFCRDRPDAVSQISPAHGRDFLAALPGQQ